MRKFLLLSITALIGCAMFVCCSAPDDSENGPVKYFNMTKNETVEPLQADVVHRVKTRGVGISLARAFNDKNDVQLTAAQAIGINPVQSLQAAYSIDRPIVRIETCEDFYLDTLTHSMPYLVPKAANLLHEIGKAFTDTVMSRTEGHKCRIKVTSVLRTDNTIKRLRRRNVNATDSSCHMYGTTFDISWIRFNYDEPGYIMYTEDLKNVLAEVLYKLREDGRCYVKFERKQSCFHITAR